MIRLRRKLRRLFVKSLIRFSIFDLALSLYVNSQLLKPRILGGNLRLILKGAPDGLPTPPLRYITLVQLSPDIQEYIHHGENVARNIVNVLTKNGLAIDGLNVLDFGCGCGRMIRHFRGKAQLFGTDYNHRIIEWCTQNLPFARFNTNSLAPPTRYPEEKFDLIYAISVFTHLPEKLQLAWMKEFRRILKNNGLLLLTTHGEHFLDRLKPNELTRFNSGDLVVRWPAYSGKNLCAAFHPEQYVRSTLSNGYSVLDFVPSGLVNLQDIFLMRNEKF